MGFRGAMSSALQMYLLVHQRGCRTSKVWSFWGKVAVLWVGLFVSGAWFSAEARAQPRS